MRAAPRLSVKSTLGERARAQCRPCARALSRLRTHEMRGSGTRGARLGDTGRPFAATLRWS
ncbi:hypothetical protein SLNWT_0109 [Streptomyces albus]|uniref:Uncharacterized protein n=1 Tax=Streptomyces albus (strain ATCC 21838 / DSM 41398 / FERM P-419 / JCM 4703 / NBRC 107858) TaxID=1081613 RepID=A0A0B5EMA3_STRA4|nr:hypothetical protein SLNWT_0109 [Streptomyces albus]AOU74800.1 hypothetical protein SLNHY_0109 [Streptomyces albus]AYN30611.1 hypothetical protein DUI70_0107 [Streptomyces albus]